MPTRGHDDEINTGIPGYGTHNREEMYYFARRKQITDSGNVACASSAKTTVAIQLVYQVSAQANERPWSPWYLMVFHCRP